VIPSPHSRTGLESRLLALFNDFVTGEIVKYGYLAIFLLMVLESACIPIPSEVTMLFGGALVTATFLAPEQQLSLLPVVLAGTFGNLVGSWLSYWAGYVGGRPLIDRWGRYLLLRPHEIDRAHAWFERYGHEAVFVGRLLPVVRTFISLPAGVARMRFWKFTLYTLLGCLPWSFALAFLGYKLGERWNEVERVVRPFSWIIAIGAIGAIAWWIWHRLRDRRADEAGRGPGRARDPS
jgi:membrane protein DedA with SNARE-associated domain